MENEEYTKPEKADKGKIAVITTSMTEEPAMHRNIRKGFKTLESMGFRIFEPQYIYKEYPETEEGYKKRAQIINSLFSDKSISGIIFRSGGFGTENVIRYLDDRKIKENPKMLCGYSDDTFLLLYIHEKLGMVVFHGPSLTSGLSNPSKMTSKYFTELFYEKKYPLEIQLTSFAAWNKGEATGKAIGGNLTRLAEYIRKYPDTDFKGRILFIEDTDETAESIKKMINELEEKEAFKQTKGILIGTFLGLGKEELKEVKEHILKKINKRNIPIIYGFKSGHGKDKLTIPFGTDITVKATTLKVIYEEYPFRTEEEI